MSNEPAPSPCAHLQPNVQLVELLNAYRLVHADESDTARRLLDFVSARPDAFLRSCAPGHVTGSAFIVDPSIMQTLLVHHRKLGKWLQPGGHCEAGETALQTAMREAFEETGVPATPLSPDHIFDIDIHQIPDRPEVPAHLHYDVRFLLVALPGQTTISHESHAVEWVHFDETLRRNSEASMARMIAKANTLSIAKANTLSIAKANIASMAERR